jgi:hypothetical protein
MSTAPIPAKLTRRIDHVLFPGWEEGPAPMPPSFKGRMLWMLGRFADWSILVLAILNLAVVVFDFTYLDLRHHYLKLAPALVERYDPVKGVAPHRMTQSYLERADLTFAYLKVNTTSPESGSLLQEMRAHSATLIHEDPFAGSGLSGVLEQIKNKMRRHTGRESAKEAFQAFWTAENMTRERVAQEAAFFEREIKPLIARNYFRGMGENGRPFDAFWIIDLLFVPFFALEFLVRGGIEIARGRHPSWKAFCYARWYDLVYFLPVGAYLIPFGQSGWVHLVRGISVGNRMQRLGLINPIHVPQEFAGKLVDLVTDLVSVRLLSNTQESVRKFDLEETLGSLTPEQRVAVMGFFEQQLRVVLGRVLPQVAPELEGLLTYAALQALNESPAYQNLKQIPFLGSLPERHLPDLVAEVVAGTQRIAINSLQDEAHREQLNRLIDKASAIMLDEMHRNGTEDHVKAILVDLIEQQKRKLLA